MCESCIADAMGAVSHGRLGGACRRGRQLRVAGVLRIDRLRALFDHGALERRGYVHTLSKRWRLALRVRGQSAGAGAKCRALIVLIQMRTATVYSTTYATLIYLVPTHTPALPKLPRAEPG